MPGGVYIGLGSNLDEPIAQLRRALAELDELTATRLIRASSLYGNPPMGPADQPDYINAAAALRTRLSPRDLLSALLRVEHAHGRSRGGTSTRSP